MSTKTTNKANSLFRNKLLVTGSTGLVGSRFLALYKDKFSITSIGRSNVDIIINLLSEKEVKRAVESSESQAVINFAAYTNVDEAEKQKGDKNGETYILNTLLPLWLAEACQSSGKKLLHISTDYVFDGNQNDRPYKESDSPHPVNSWYSITKYKGEISITKSFREDNFTIIRISYPYSGMYSRKPDIARAVIDNLHTKQFYSGIINQRIKPTSVDDIADAINLLLNKNATGIFHVAGNFYPDGYITPYDFASKIAEIFKLDSSLIKAINFNEFSKGRIVIRPQHTWLDTSKIESLGFYGTCINRALARFKQQLTSHR